MNKIKNIAFFLLLSSSNHFIFTQERLDLAREQINTSKADFKMKALYQINERMRFHAQEPKVYSISFNLPSAYFFEYFKNLLQESEIILGKDHIITSELTSLYNKLDAYWWDEANFYANNTQARYAEENFIKNCIQKINTLINQL